MGVAAALTLAGGGMVAQAAAAVEPAVSRGTDLAPWLQGGGSAAAVAGLVYVARMIVKGDLVPRAVAEREAEAAKQRQVALDLAQDAHARETVAANIGNESIKALTQNAEMMRQVAEELRWWRDRRPATRGDNR